MVTWILFGFGTTKPENRLLSSCCHPYVVDNFFSSGRVNCQTYFMKSWKFNLSPEIITILIIEEVEVSNYVIQFSSVQSLNCVWLFATPRIAAHQASLSITNSRSSLRLTSIKSVMPSSHLILCRPLLLLPPIPPSIGVFSNESTLRMRWPKYWSFSFSIIPSKEHPGLISFRMDWLDFLAVQGTLKSLLQHHSSKIGYCRSKTFYMDNLGKTYPWGKRKRSDTGSHFRFLLKKGLYVLFFIASSNSWKILILVDSIATVSIATLWQAKFSGIIGEKFCFVWIFL